MKLSKDKIYLIMAEQNLFQKDLADKANMSRGNLSTLLNGKSCQAYVCATPDGKALYFAREKKGHEGVKGTVTEDYQGILVHDHDITFYNYGADHQECLAHVLRYLKASIENEPNRTWNKKMHALVQEMVHFRNGCRQPHGPDPEIVSSHIFLRHSSCFF